MDKTHVIIKIGKVYALKRKLAPDLFGPGIYSSKKLENVKQFAASNNITVTAIGDIYEV